MILDVSDTWLYPNFATLIGKTVSHNHIFWGSLSSNKPNTFRSHSPDDHPGEEKRT